MKEANSLKKCKLILLNLFSFSFLYLILFFQSTVAIAAEPMSYEDIISFAKPQWVEISPLASKIAYCARKGSLELNCNLDTIYIFNIKNSRQEKIIECDVIFQACWGNQDQCLYVLIKDKNLYKIIQYKGGKINFLVESSEPILLMTLTADKNNLYYTKTKFGLTDAIQEDEEEGRVFDVEQKNFIKSLVDGNKCKESEEIWQLNLLDSKSELVTSLPCENLFNKFSPLIVALHVSSNNNYLLLNCQNEGRPDLGGTPFKNDVIVFDLNTSQWYQPLKESIDIEEVSCWINEKEFVFQQISYRNETIDYSIWWSDARSQQNNCLNWLTINDEIKKFHWNEGILYGVSESTLYKIFWQEKKVEQIKIPDSFHDSLSFDKQARYIGFINESSALPPEIAIYDTTMNKLTRLTTLNPTINKKALGHVEKLTIETKSGYKSTGYLLHPIGEQIGRRYPLIIATYGFHGKFITDAEWHSSFPAQTLAGEGYLVLLLNAPGTSQGFIGDPEKARQVEGWNKLELFEQAVDTLVEQGIADSQKVGIYGWSHGAFIVNFVISHSNKFHVACLGEGGDYNPGGFWAGGNFMWPKIYECTFGGPPWGSTLKNYIDFSPFFHVDKIHSPLLLEFADVLNTDGLEMYIPLRYLGVPAELVTYKGEEHNFVKPKARLASMARKLEWFNFWFFGKKNSEPKKQKQYERWEKMREESIEKGVLHTSLV